MGWGWAASRGRRPVAREVRFSIGIYAGHDPLALADAPGVHNPVLTARSVTDMTALFVADPFLLRAEGRWWLFFEALEAGSKRGVIALASSEDGLRWTYERVVLREPFHLSYPYVMEWEGNYYMVPESHQDFAVRLYRAVEFPYRWERCATLVERNCVDSSPFFYEGRWWMFSGAREDVLLLYMADDLRGPWREHPRSPIVRGDRRLARPGGRVLVRDGQVLRFAQDGQAGYGSAVWPVVVDEISPTTYHEHVARDHPLLSGNGLGWNARGMHQVDAQEIAPGRYLASVDGWAKSVVFGWHRRRLSGEQVAGALADGRWPWRPQTPRQATKNGALAATGRT